MIIYIFNGYFPESSGFGRRCLREIEALSTLEDVIVVCRKKGKEPIEEIYSKKIHTIKIARYQAKSEIVHQPDNYKGNGLYEAKRNLDIMISLAMTLQQLIRRYKRRDLHLYVVTSPLTVPLLTLLIAKVFRVEPTLVSFHDLEPELAMHLKRITKNHLIVKIELYLERMVCKGYKKILVTSQGQADRIIERTKISKSKVLAIPNTTDVTTFKKSNLKSEMKLPFTKNDFVLLYMSTLSFGYTVDGFINFLIQFKKVISSFPNLKVGVIGRGEGLPTIKSSIIELGLEKQVICLGFIENPEPILKEADAAIIPWEQDIMTETMLPTKLFEYLALSIPVLAPNFGEFKQILTHNENAFLYNKNEDIFNLLKFLVNDTKLKSNIGQKGHTLYINNYAPELLNNKLIEFILK